VDAPGRHGATIPASLERLRVRAGGRAWLADVPGLLAESCRRWSLSPGAPFEGGHCSLALPVTGPGGMDAVLKLQFPDRESEHEAAALAAWAGDGAVRLLGHAVDLHALLLERCLPGTHLSERPADEALAVLAELVGRLSVPADGPFPSLADEAARWSQELPLTWARAGRPFERELVDHVLEVLDRLPATQGRPVLVHQDLHADNVLRAERERWLVIDPKPVVGERELAAAPIVRSAELGHDRASVIRRLDHLSEALGLDRNRARDWAFAQTMAWSFDELTPLGGHLDTARWLLSA
jgi:streptomycin 6-kinase